MEKRGRGRPKKIASHKLDQTMAECDQEVPYSDKLPEFFKIYIPAMCSKRMRIPPEFMEKFGGNIPTIVTLRRPSGISRQVDMNRINDYWFLQKGWPEFVQENSLEDGDFLTFSYAGNSMFYVKVFAINGCRKEVDYLKGDEASESENSKHEEAKGKDLSPRRRSRRISMCSDLSFTVVATNSYIHKGWMHIPAHFWSAYGGGVGGGSTSTMATLWMKNKSWSVGFMKLDNRVIFSKGWGKFVKDNSLQNGNLCTFQLIDRSHLAFNVTLDT